jgi:hypothetical protein
MRPGAFDRHGSSIVDFIASAAAVSTARAQLAEN